MSSALTSGSFQGLEQHVLKEAWHVRREAVYPGVGRRVCGRHTLALHPKCFPVLICFPDSSVTQVHWGCVIEIPATLVLAQDAVVYAG